MQIARLNIDDDGAETTVENKDVVITLAWLCHGTAKCYANSIKANDDANKMVVTGNNNN